MTELIENYIEDIKHNHELLKNLKNEVVKAKHYELGSKLREIELLNFPETEEQKALNEEIKKTQLFLRMLKIDCDEQTAYKLKKGFETYFLQKGNFDIEMASDIVHDAESLFIN